MYIRFVTPSRDARARAEIGLFGPAYDLRGQYRPSDAPWQVHEIHREICWFDRHLAVPPEFTVQRARHRGQRNGICWFRDRADAPIGHAWYLAWLLEEMGVPVRQIRSDAPGTILWSDADQIVALPDRDHPRLFH